MSTTAAPGRTATPGRIEPARGTRDRLTAGEPATSGFTLIELLIAIAIVAVLTAVALPSYLGQLRRSVRAEAQTVLTDMASRQQQFLIDRRAYALSVASLGVTPPASLNGKFNFAVVATSGPPPTFMLTATGLGGQVYDHCPVLTVDNAGNRSPADCW